MAPAIVEIAVVEDVHFGAAFHLVHKGDVGLGGGQFLE
jgi:hypothetical protein